MDAGDGGSGINLLYVWTGGKRSRVWFDRGMKSKKSDQAIEDERRRGGPYPTAFYALAQPQKVLYKRRVNFLRSLGLATNDAFERARLSAVPLGDG